MKKLGFSLVLLFLAICLLPSVSAADEEGNMQIRDVYEYENNSGEPAKDEFIDEDLVGDVKSGTSSDGVSTQGVTHEEYSHSYYEFSSKSITEYNVGPITNETHLISVAKGETQTLTSSKTVSGSVEYSGSVSGSMANVINVELTGSASGSVSKTYSTTVEYSGPPESSSYNSRNYYGGVQYDEYSTVLKKYDVYDVYMDGSYYNQKTYYDGTVNVNQVKKPKIINYSRDTTY